MKRLHCWRGFRLDGNIAEFSGNVAMGNGTGVEVDSQPVAIFQGNTFAGNSSNCGVRNFSGTTLMAAGNYWGAATGPGADPADGACDNPSNLIVTTPFLTHDPTKPQNALR